MDITPEDVYRALIDCEERAAAIYMVLASRFSHNSDLSSFWLEMALQEKQHAGLLQFCVCERLFAHDLPGSDELRNLSALFDRVATDAGDPDLTVEDAFKLALELEVSEMNSIYCSVTTPLHASMYLLRRKIATMLPDHVAELIAAARRFGVDERSLRALVLANEQCADTWKPKAEE